MSEPTPATRSFAEKFSHLIATIHPADRGPYTDQEIAEQLHTSRQYVWQLRRGERGEPRQSIVHEITKFFGVPDTYFSDDDVAQTVDDEITALVNRRDASAAADDPREGVEARRLAQRYLSLGPEGRAAVSSLIDSLDAYGKQSRSTRSRRKPGPSSS
ncbi:helix-turn-helix domain-containing protein [Prauserella endophytica]|uniref:Helix-turn-helix transcriptional regulator n=1 Tax=Prauserella endophytica TaxID=1592324 RepID=A0ABY2RUW9_9PSEU|nr:helix-turn-helix domain-containing protein [Prauserella endophytica]TKG61505.1 helix-turn-helix transcriptional regulator [Prauserella endophytica]